MKKKLVSLMLAALLAVALCAGTALACGQAGAASMAAEGTVLMHCHSGGRGRHGGHGHHGKGTACDWLFHACGDCADVNCSDEDHAHRCPTDCTNKDHRHYGVCRYADGTLALTKKRA